MRRTCSLILPALLLAACDGDKISDPVPTAPAGDTPTETATVQSTAAITVLMSGLDVPHGLEWGPEGGLYVAEAGTRAINGPGAPVHGTRDWTRSPISSEAEVVAERATRR